MGPSGKRRRARVRAVGSLKLSLCRHTASLSSALLYWHGPQVELCFNREQPIPFLSVYTGCQGRGCRWRLGLVR